MRRIVDKSAGVVCIYCGLELLFLHNEAMVTSVWVRVEVRVPGTL